MKIAAIKPLIAFEDFEKIDIRIGTIVRVEEGVVNEVHEIHRLAGALPGILPVLVNLRLSAT